MEIKILPHRIKGFDATHLFADVFGMKIWVCNVNMDEQMPGVELINLHFVVPYLRVIQEVKLKILEECKAAVGRMQMEHFLADVSEWDSIADLIWEGRG